jgi:hypothetical protein
VSAAAAPPGRTRLHGRTVFLSASVPSHAAAARYRRSPHLHLQIQEAVVSLARAVFAAGGRLVFGGHPAISPLVAMVAGEYIRPRLVDGHPDPAEVPIIIYQSRAFEGSLPEDTLMMFRASYAALVWTEAVGGERLDPRGPRPFCPLSLRHMRERMLRETNPAAMVCIGGMEGVEEELAVFRELRDRAPIYLFGETGGAAALLGDQVQARDPRWVHELRYTPPTLRVIDREVLAALEQRRHEAGLRPAAPFATADEPAVPAVPFPLIAQLLVEELGGDLEPRPG